MAAFRSEADLLGTIRVPAEALYGAQTQRAVENFPVGKQPTLGDFPPLVNALAWIKQAAAATNVAIGALPPQQGIAIAQAAAQVLAGDLYHAFPIHYLHGGGGTSANMNMNEVLANLAEERLGGRRGQYQYIHPNDHVNLHQSTNDVYPTACHLAIMTQWQPLASAFAVLKQTLRAKIDELGAQPRLARTCLQDAVAVTYGDFLGGYLELITRNQVQIANVVAELAQVNLGGTIVGRAGDVPAAYFAGIIEQLNGRFPHGPLRRSRNLYDAAQNVDDLITVASRLDVLARALIKISKDLRLLGSGPEAGLGELHLPAVQPGSSMMPGKVNPVIPEFVIQIGFRMVGNYQMCAMALDHGELDLNVWESPLVFGILESMTLAESALLSLSTKCLAGLTAPVEPNLSHAHSTIALLTELAKTHGYSTISKLCQQAGDVTALRKLLQDGCAPNEGR